MAVHGRGIIPCFVPPLILGRMSQPPVQLDHYGVLLVHAIPAPPAAARPGKWHLPARLR